MNIRNNRTIPPDTDQLARAAVFVAVARAASFSGAAKQLGVARSTVSERVRMLEEVLGVKLLERSTRSVRLTQEGEMLLEHMERVLDAWTDAQQLLDNRRQEPAGLLRVTAPGGVADSVVAVALAELMAQYPQVDAELLVDDSIRDLMADNIDVAIRMASLQDSRLIARKLGDTPLLIVAAPSYARRIGRSLQDLRAADWVGHSAAHRGEIHVRRKGEDQIHRLRPRFRAFASSSAGERALLAAGVGLSSMPSMLVKEDLQSGRLVHIAPWCGPFLPVHAIYSARRLMPPRTVRFLELLAKQFELDTA